MQQALRGVVWHPPENVQRAMEDMQLMVEYGVEAVRLPAERIDERLHLPLADSLGLQLFVDLPFAGLSAAGLLDSLHTESSWPDRILRWTEQHHSVRHVGLTRWSDTGRTRVCRALQQWVDELRNQGPPDLQLYYATPFLRGDRCEDIVDFVLLNTLDTDPLDQLTEWHSVHGPRPVGLANLGYQTDARVSNGLLHPRSSSSQARFLETHLRALLTDTEQGLVALFIYKWRDLPANRSPSLRSRELGRTCCYGLLTADDTRRPALEVMTGIFTGAQTVFSFPAGSPPPPTPPWIILAGWIAIAILGSCFAFSVLVRRLVPRYVIASGFYRESVRGGRELPRRATFALTGAIALAGGTTGAALIQALSESAALTLLLAQFPLSIQLLAFTLLDQTWLLILVFTALSLFSIICWAAAIILLSARKRRLSMLQGLTLVVWPRWSIFLIMFGAMLLTTLPPEVARDGTLLLAVLWLALFCIRTVRVMLDVNRVARPSHPLHPLVLSPLTPLVGVLLLCSMLYFSEMAFFWRLLQGGE